MQSRPAVRDERYVARRRHPCGTASVASRHRVVPRRPRILAPPSPRLDRYREAPRRRGRITVADNVAEQLVQQLIEAGVERIYGIVGDSLNPIVDAVRRTGGSARSEEHTSELPSLMRTSYAVFCLKKKSTKNDE